MTIGRRTSRDHRPRDGLPLEIIASRIGHIPLALLTALALGGPAQAAPVPEERALYSDAPNGMFLLDRDWTSRSDPRDVGRRQGWQRPGTTGFRPTTVPDAFNAGDLSRKSFRGSVHWYRASFARPALDGVSQWRLRFESVNVNATVWLNGRRLGTHRGAYLPFELGADPALLKPDDNELVIRVDSRGSRHDLPPANRPRGWWNFGGILHEVYLRAVRSFELRDLYVTASPGTPALARIRARIENRTVTSLPAAATVRVTGPDGFDTTRIVDLGTAAPGASAALDTTVEIPAPRLWHPTDPALYVLTVDLPGGQRTSARFGIREWDVVDGRIRLNGAPLALRGASFHEQTRERGAALTPADRDEIVSKLVAIGANSARQHYPPHPALLEAFDREGIVFWEQIPVWRVRDANLRDARLRGRALRAFREAILRDRNHASVMAWSASNETLGGGSGESRYLRAARATAEQYDPTRLLVADKALRPLRDIPRSYRLLDAIGINEYVGWYGGRTGELRTDLATVRRRFPRQALVVTEFGAEANRSGPATRKGTYSFQDRFLRDHLRIIDGAEHVSGAIVWALRDFAVRPGWRGGNPRPRPPVLFKGLFTEAGKPKPAARRLQQLFAAALRAG